MGWLPLEDENGNPVYDENGEVKKVYGHLQRKVNSLLEVETNPNIGIDSEKYKHSLLTELNTFLLTVKDKGGIPLYKQRYTPVANIQNINIYEEE
jgi:hypothetical protein